MKDYIKTKIWINEICYISSECDSSITYYQSEIDRYKENLETSGDNEYINEQIEEYTEKINCREWVLKLINAPFKIK